MRLFVLQSGAFAAATVGAAGGTTPRSHTRSQLAIMVLPKSALGSEANGLDVDPGSGFTDNAAAADTTLDPNDSGRQVVRSGRIAGCELTYTDLSSAPFARGSGLLSLASSVDLFKSARSADAFITKQLRDARRFRGKRVDFGMSLLASSAFDTSSARFGGSTLSSLESEVSSVQREGGVRLLPRSPRDLQRTPDRARPREGVRQRRGNDGGHRHDRAASLDSGGIVAGRASTFHFSDVRPLVDTFAKRIKDGL